MLWLDSQPELQRVKDPFPSPCRFVLSPRDGTVEARLLNVLASWKREYRMETVLTELRRAFVVPRVSTAWD